MAIQADITAPKRAEAGLRNQATLAKLGEWLRWSSLAEQRGGAQIIDRSVNPGVR
jgi:hypothetical protein